MMEWEKLRSLLVNLDADVNLKDCQYNFVSVAVYAAAGPLTASETNLLIKNNII